MIPASLPVIPTLRGPKQDVQPERPMWFQLPKLSTMKFRVTVPPHRHHVVEEHVNPFISSILQTGLVNVILNDTNHKEEPRLLRRGSR